MKKMKGILICLCFLLILSPPLTQLGRAKDVISSSFLSESQSMDNIQITYLQFNGIIFSKETRKISHNLSKKQRAKFRKSELGFKAFLAEEKKAEDKA